MGGGASAFARAHPYQQSPPPTGTPKRGRDSPEGGEGSDGTGEGEGEGAGGTALDDDGATALLDGTGRIPIAGGGGVPAVRKARRGGAGAGTNHPSALTPMRKARRGGAGTNHPSALTPMRHPRGLAAVTPAPRPTTLTPTRPLLESPAPAPFAPVPCGAVKEEGSSGEEDEDEGAGGRKNRGHIGDPNAMGGGVGVGAGHASGPSTGPALSTSPPGAPFRFTSFPASLPRVNAAPRGAATPRWSDESRAASTPCSEASTVLEKFGTPLASLVVARDGRGSRIDGQDPSFSRSGPLPASVAESRPPSLLTTRNRAALLSDGKGDDAEGIDDDDQNDAGRECDRMHGPSIGPASSVHPPLHRGGGVSQPSSRDDRHRRIGEGDPGRPRAASAAGERGGLSDHPLLTTSETVTVDWSSPTAVNGGGGEGEVGDNGLCPLGDMHTNLFAEDVREGECGKGGGSGSGRGTDGGGGRR